MPAHRQPDQQVAMFAYQAADALSFVANDEGKRTCEIGLVVLYFGFACQPNYPDVLRFKEIDGACEVGFLGDQQVFSGTCGGFDHGGVDLSRPVFRQDHAMHTDRLGCTQQGAKVVDILDGVKDEQKWRFLFAFGMGKYLVYAGICARFDNRYTALVDCAMTELVKLETGHRLSWNVQPVGLL